MTIPYDYFGSDPLTVALQKRLRDQPDMELTLDRVHYTLQELHDQAAALAGSLQLLIKPGDRIVLMARNGRLALLTWWAATWCGALLVPLNTSNRGSIVRHQISDCDPQLIVLEREFAEVLAGPLRDLGLTVPAVAQGEMKDIATGLPADYPGERFAFEDLVRNGHSYTGNFGLDPYGTSHLIYTAGTTGPSKACMVSHGYLGNMARQMAENLERAQTDRLWTSMPLFHLSAVCHTIGSLQLGSPIIVSKQFSVSRFWAEVIDSEATMAALMGSMLPMIAGAPESEESKRAFGQLRVVSGSPVTVDLVKTWQQRFGVHRVGSGAYGMTEAGLITMTPVGEYRAGSAGRLNDSFQVQIVDDRDHPLPVGAVGEIVCRPNRPGIMFNGYWNQPEQTLEVFRGLWFHCGDLGRLDEDGYLYFVDRGKDYLRRGGENISSFEMESVIAEHPMVGEVAVHAVISPLNEDEVKVTVVPAVGAEESAAQLWAWIQPRVPRYAVPSHIEFRTELPKNEVGRVLKRDLRDDGITATTWSCDPRSYVPSDIAAVTP